MSEELKGTVRQVEEPMPYLWKVGMSRAEDGGNTALIEVGDQYEIDGEDESQLVSQVGFKAVVVGLQLMGASEDERKMLAMLILKTLDTDLDG